MRSGVGSLRPRVCLGPPGCGKTTQLLARFTDELAGGVQPERIALMTFTRAARQEAYGRAQKRFAFSQSRLIWVRTIHSAAFRLLQLERGEILEGERLADFARRYGYELTIDGRRIDDEMDSSIVRGRTRDDDLLFAYEWGRNNLLDLEQTLARCPVDDLSATQLRLFVRRLEEFKDEHKLLDFSNLLERVLEQGLRPDVDVAMVDEAHDLSPLQIAVVEMWFVPCLRTYVAADDDQAIFGWQGASPTWINTLAQQTTPEVLENSHRVPRSVHALAERIIARNRHRRPKRYNPADRDGRIVRCEFEQAMTLVEGSDDAFVLVRNRVFIRRVAMELVERGVPFSVDGWGGRSPLDDVFAVRAIELVLKLEQNHPGPFPTGHVWALLHFIPEQSARVGRDAHSRVRDRKGHGSYVCAGLIEQLGFGPLLDAIANDGPLAVLEKMSRDDRHYFQRLIDRHGEVPKPTATVTTIHVAKGLERDLVVVIPDMTRPTYAAYLKGGAEHNEAENRVFYVAVTRTKNTLVLVEPSTRRHYEFPRVEEAGMRSPRVTDIRFAPARPELRRKGLIAWACCVIDGAYKLDGLAVRETADGNVRVSFPSRVDGNGVAHAIYRPLTPAARAAIERPILESLRRRGVLP